MFYRNNSLDLILKKARLKTFPQGQILIYEGDPPGDVYFIKKGYVKVYDIDKDGHEKILSIVKPQNIMPYSFFSGTQVSNKWFYETLCDSELYVMNGEELSRLMEKNGSITLSLVSSFSQEVHELLTRLSSLGKSKSHAKLVSLMRYFIVCLEEEVSTKKWWKVPFPVNHQFLADITGMTRESCALTMKDLSAHNVVRYSKSSILEINRKKVFED